MVKEQSRLTTLIPVLLFLALVIISYFVIKPLALSLFVAALLAYAFQPLYKILLKKTKKKNLSSTIICIIVLIIIILPLALLTRVLIQQSFFIYTLIKQRLATGIFQGCTADVCLRITDLLSTPEIQSQLQNISRFFTEYIINKSSEFIVALPTLLINLFVMIFSLFYFLRDGPRIITQVGEYLAVKKKSYAKILSRLKEVTKAIIYGYVVMAILQGILGGLGFFVFGIDSALFWGLVMAFLAMLPYFGTGLVTIPAVTIMIINGLSQNSNSLIIKGIALGVYSLLVVGGIDNVLRPKIVSDRANIHPVLILIGIFGGVVIFGFLGVIIGPLVLSLTAIIIEEYLGQGEKEVTLFQQQKSSKTKASSAKSAKAKRKAKATSRK